MKNVFKKFWVSVIAILAMLCSLVGCKLTNDNATIAFKDTMVSYVTVNTTLNVSEYLEYTEGYDVELKAEYAGGSYKTYGLSFMPTELGEVTLTASLKGTKAKATATVEVRIAPPKVTSENECIRYRGEAFEIDSLKEALNVVAKNDEYTFKAISATLLGGEEVISFDGLTEYTFEDVGNYEIAYELSNAGGTTKGTFVLWVKRVLTENELNDISNYGQGIFSNDSATVTVDETEKAENSDWCFVVKADPAATGKSDTDYTQNYWTNYAHLQIEDGISLSEKYLELDVQFSADSRDLMIFQFVDAGFTQSSVDYVVRAVEGRPWQHVSFKDVYKYGNYEYLRIIVLHPQTSDLESYNAANVWVKVDNVTLHEYDLPYEYNEPITYTYTENDYTASEGFEEAKMLWSDLANSKNYTSIIQVGEYANEETEFNFTLKDAGIGAYEFAIGARVDNDDPMKGVFVEFKRDAGNAFFNIWGTKLAGEWIDAQTLFFADEHNYTVRLAIDGTTLKMLIIDNTTEQTIADYEKDLSAYVMGETGGFIFTTRKDVEVACMKPHAIIVEQEVKETTISNITIGDTNTLDYIHLNIGSGQFPAGIISATNNLAYAEGTFSQGATWTTAANELKFKGNVGVLADTATTLQVFPTGTTPSIGDKLNIPEGSTIIVGEYKTTFGEEVNFWFNGETWQAEEVARPGEPKEVTIKNITLGESKAINQVTLVIGEGTLQSAVVGSTSNWSSCDTFGKVAKIGEHTFYAVCGVLANGANGIVLFPTAQYVTEGVKLNIPVNATVTVGEYSVIFGEEVNLWFNGETWQAEEYVVTPPVTPDEPEQPEEPTVTVISGVVIGEWCAEYSTANQLRVNAISNNIPTTVVNWNKQLGIVGVSSMYGGGAADWFAMDLDPAATVGTAITIPTTEFVVDGMTYKFDQEYTFYFDGTAWGTEFVAVPEEPEVPAVTVISELTVRPSQNQTASLAYINVASNNVPVPNPAENWNKQLGIAGVTSMYGGTSGWFAFELSTPATVGTVVVLPADKEFTVGDKVYKFDKEYSIYFDGSVWTMEFVAVPEEPQEPAGNVISGLSISTWTTSNATSLYINVTSNNIPTTVVNWVWTGAGGSQSEFGSAVFSNKTNISSNISIYGGGADFFIATALDAVAGSKLVIPGNKIFTVDGKDYTFDQDYTFYFDGTTWSTSEYVAPTATVISQVLMGEWCTSTSKATQIRVNAASLNIPTTVVNWIWTGEGGGLSEFGKKMTSSASSIYGQGQDWFVIELHAAATEGTQIVLVGNKIFTVDGVDYMFDRDYTFTYSNGTWTVA